MTQGTESVDNSLNSLKKNIKTLSSLISRNNRLVESQVKTYRKLSNENITTLEEELILLRRNCEKSKDNEYFFDCMNEALNEIKRNFITGNYDKINENIIEFKDAYRRIAKKADLPFNFQIDLPHLPEEIEDIIKSDISELEICFKAGAYRSCLILCGRIIETGLHRKYFEKTDNDLLVSEPNIGIGKLIKRLNEEGIVYPGLREQIDMINQLRIYSVHKKIFDIKSNKNQAYGAILYTIDILKRLFEHSE